MTKAKAQKFNKHILYVINENYFECFTDEQFESSRTTNDLSLKTNIFLLHKVASDSVRPWTA
jgi:hypothetical protein